MKESRQNNTEVLERWHNRNQHKHKIWINIWKFTKCCCLHARLVETKKARETICINQWIVGEFHEKLREKLKNHLNVISINWSSSVISYKQDSNGKVVGQKHAPKVLQTGQSC